MSALEFFRLQTRQEVLALYTAFAPVGAEEVELAGAVGRVLAGPVTAAEDGAGVSPGHHGRLRRAARDTFGASVGAPQYLEIKGEVAMGVAPSRGVGPGEILRVATGGHAADWGRRRGHDRIHRRTSGPDPGGAPGRGPGGKCLAARRRRAARGSCSSRPAGGCGPRRSASWRPWAWPAWRFTKNPGWRLSLPATKSSPSTRSPAPARCGIPTPIWPRPRWPEWGGLPLMHGHYSG